MMALGLIETRGTLAAVEAADAHGESCGCHVVEKTRVGGGLVAIAVTGDVAAVQAAVDARCGGGGTDHGFQPGSKTGHSTAS